MKINFNLIFIVFYSLIQVFSCVVIDEDIDFEIDGSDPSIVLTEYGYIQGFATSQSRSFMGVPFATSPTGILRWTNPIEPSSWSGIRQCINPAPGCIQNDPGSQWWSTTSEFSEDCLYLNVYTPGNVTNNTNNNSTLLPVMFFIHGGTFVGGSGGAPLYNGTLIVNTTNVILVTINYRLGIMGFYWDDKTGAIGNYGIEDQILALRWVQNNIRFFGGDPNKITIFGQSAGAMSVALLMSVKDINFQGCIWESEPIGIPFRNNKTWGKIPDLIRFYSNCSNINCLRNVSSNELLNIQNQVGSDLKIEVTHYLDLFVPWTPTVNTPLLPDQPLWIFQQHQWDYDTPMTIGTVHDEGVLFVYEGFTEPMNKSLVEALAVYLVGAEDAIKVFEQYPLPPESNTSDYRPYSSVIITDALFRCPARNISTIFSMNGNQHTYFYRYNHIPSYSQNIWEGCPYCWNTVCHGDDLASVYHPPGSLANTTYTPQENILSYIIQGYWSNFAKTGSPGNGNSALNDTTTWFEWNMQTRYTALLDIGPIQMVSKYDDDPCDFWDEIGYIWLNREGAGP